MFHEQDLFFDNNISEITQGSSWMCQHA